MKFSEKEVHAQVELDSNIDLQNIELSEIELDDELLLAAHRC